MHIRDGHGEDVAAIRALAPGDVDPLHLIRERTVRVAELEGRDGEDGTEKGAVVGFLAFTSRPRAIHVTRLGGSNDALDALVDDCIEESGRGARPVVAVVPDGGPEAVALETKGFEVVAAGPRFRGRETTRYRLEPV